MTKKTETIITLIIGLILYVIIFYQHFYKWELTLEIRRTEVVYFFYDILRDIMADNSSSRRLARTVAMFIYWPTNLGYLCWLWFAREKLTNLLWKYFRKFYNKI